MKIPFLLTTALLLAGRAIAAPHPAEARSEVVPTAAPRRALHGRVSNDQNVAQVSTATNGNWAGAVLTSAPAADATYTYVSATWTIPTPTPTSAAASVTQAASFWVGIDGGTEGNAIWQAGVDIYVTNGETTYAPWYEWFPAETVDINMDFTAGDVVVCVIQSTSSSEGTVILENQSNGQSITTTASAPASTATLAGQNAEWIMEDLAADGGGLTLLNFDEVSFTGIVAQAGGQNYDLSESSVDLFESDENDLFGIPTLVSDTQVDVTYQHQ